MNPFLNKISTKQLPLIVLNELYKNNQGNKTFFTNVEFEKDEHIRVYQDEIFLNLLLEKEIKPSTLKLFLYIIYNIKKVSSDLNDKISIKPKEVGVFLGMSRSTLFDSIKQLKKLNLIENETGRGSNSSYWVNPKYIYKGNRLQYMENNGKKDRYYIANTIEK